MKKQLIIRLGFVKTNMTMGVDQPRNETTAGAINLLGSVSRKAVSLCSEGRNAVIGNQH